MTAKQERWLGKLMDSAQFTENQRVGVLRYMDASDVITALAPPKGTPMAERDSLTHAKGRRLLNAMSDFAAAGEPTAEAALAYLRDDDETANWMGLDGQTKVDETALPWADADRLNDLAAERKADADEARRQAWEAVH